MKMEFKITKKHKIDSWNRNITDIAKAKNSELESFIKDCLRQTSSKTGKQIKINTYKWSKKDLLDLIIRSGYQKDCLEYLNTKFYSDIEVYQVDELSLIGD